MGGDETLNLLGYLMIGRVKLSPNPKVYVALSTLTIQPLVEANKRNGVDMNNEPEVRCTQCGSMNDSMLQFTKYQICGRCTRKNHKKVINK